jgi:STAM-binding protein
MFAINAYAVTDIPTFIENSALDMWQTWCILTAAPIIGFPHPKSRVNGNCSAVKGWLACSHNPENCTSAQMGTMNSFIDDYVAAVNGTKSFHAAGNGAFIHSCHTHCNGISGGWSNYKIGGDSMQEVTHNWWKSDGTEPASTYTRLPCRYHLDSPHKCNPTC